MLVGSPVSMTARLFLFDLLGLLGGRLLRGLFLYFRLNAKHSLHVLHRIFIQDQVHSTLNMPSKTRWLENVSYGAEKQGNTEKNIEDLSAQPAHLAKSEWCLFLGGLVESAVTDVNFLRQV